MEPVIIQIVQEPDLRGNREYLDWWVRESRSRFLLQDGLLEEPRVQALPADIRSMPFPPHPDIPFSRKESWGHGRSCSRTAHRERYENESKEERLFDQFKTLGDSPVQSSQAQPPPPPQPTPPPFETTDQQTQPTVVKE
ncbi:hypothetical protein PIB30_096703, partial [Stylosanthes scabra]|nr:hypothetical protein [Stylosanthes scabra]